MVWSRWITALDIGSSKITAGQFYIGRGGVPTLTNYAFRKLPSEELTKETEYSRVVSETISSLLDALPGKRGQIFVTIPGQSVFPRFIKLPPVSTDKIDRIVRYEAEQNVPFPIDEVLWDYQLVPSDTGDLYVMLVAAKLENVMALTECLELAGVEPDIIDVAPMALYNTVRYNYPDVKGCILVLDIGAKSTNLLLMEEDRIFCRNISVAGNAITQEIARELDVSFEEAEELKFSHGFVAFGGVYAGPDNELTEKISKIIRTVITRLHAEVMRSINFYRSQQGGNAPSLVLLTGGASAIAHTDTFFKEKLGLPVEYLNPLLVLPVSEQIPEQVVRKDIYFLGQIAGLGIRGALNCPMEMNLLPPVLARRKAFRRRQPYFVGAVAGLAAMMMVGGVYIMKTHTLVASQYDKVQKQIRTLEQINGLLAKAVQEKEQAEAKLNMLLELVSRRTQWIEILETIRACMFDGMWITSITPVRIPGKPIEQIDFKGMGFEDKLAPYDKTDKNHGDVTAIELFVNKLKSAGPFSKVEITEYSAPTGPRDFARKFTIKVTLKKPIEL
jgi:type IV pilus assembly protein PilM